MRFHLILFHLYIFDRLLSFDPQRYFKGVFYIIFGWVNKCMFLSNQKLNVLLSCVFSRRFLGSVVHTCNESIWCLHCGKGWEHKMRNVCLCPPLPSGLVSKNSLGNGEREKEDLMFVKGSADSWLYCLCLPPLSLHLGSLNLIYLSY